MYLDAERAADVFRDDAHLLLGQVEMLGEQVLHHVRRLRALVDREALLARVPVGDDGARFGGDAGVAAEQEGGFHHFVGRREGLVRLAHFQLSFKAEIVAELGLDHRGLRIERGFRIGDRRQFLIGDVDQLAGVFRLRAGLRHHGAHRFALPAGALDRDGVLRRRFQALQMREHADPRRHHFRHFGASDHGDHAGGFLGRRGVDLLDARMRVRRAHEGHMRHARQGDVTDILPAPLRQALQVGPRHRAADIGVRPVERGQHGGRVFGDFHYYFPPARACSLSCATASTASTMA